MPLNLLPSEQLTHSTVRIACQLADGSSATGSGFFYAFAKSATQNMPAIVTNKHVVAGAVAGQFSLTLRAQDGTPLVGQHITINLDQFENRWIPHPDSRVDLCVMPIAPLLTEAAAAGKNFFFVPLDESLLPTDSDLADISALEEILMIGYPNGIWDATNNRPILRRGITATHANIDYEGRKEFLIDAACFPGSSGSPVFLFNTNGWSDRHGNIMLGQTRTKLLGLLYAGPQHTATGEVRIVNVPTQQRAVAISTIPNNLGLVIKAVRLREMDAVLKTMYPPK
jgi:Trypsin-like peptidase domain